MATTAKTSWFAPKFRAALNESEMSVRAVARAWRPKDPETARRSLIRYLQNGIVPHPHTRAEIAAVLGLGENGLEPDDEEEPAMAQVREAASAFIDALMVAVRDRERVPS
jgi:hypothetical protein